MTVINPKLTTKKFHDTAWIVEFATEVPESLILSEIALNDSVKGRRYKKPLRTVETPDALHEAPYRYYVEVVAEPEKAVT